MRDKIFHSICFGFIFGVLVRSFLSLDFYLVVLFGVIAFSLFLFFTLISKNNWGIIFSIFVLAFCLGIFRFHAVDVPAPNVFESRVGGEATCAGFS